MTLKLWHVISQICGRGSEAGGQCLGLDAAVGAEMVGCVETMCAYLLQQARMRCTVEITRGVSRTLVILTRTFSDMCARDEISDRTFSADEGRGCYSSRRIPNGHC